MEGEGPLGGIATPDKPAGFWDATVDGGWQVPGEPYMSASRNPAEEFHWWRARMLGGRTNHWGRVSLRNGPYDFKPRSRDGLGFDWPISYEELEPYYTKVEMLVGVHGTNEGMENTPDSPSGVLLPPVKARTHELMLQKHGKKFGFPMIPIHRAVLTRKLDADSIPAKLHPHNLRAQKLTADAMRARAACFYATPCGRGCSIGATYQSTTVHLPPALASGNLDIVPNAHVREVTVNKEGKANGVIYIDKATGKEARAVVLAASSRRRFQRGFPMLSVAEQTRICDDIAWAPEAKPEFREAAHFFHRFRNLAAGAYYGSAEGWKAIGYVGNQPMPVFPGPPLEVLERLGLTQTID